MGFLDRWRMTGLCRVRKSHKFRGVHLVPGPKLVLVWDFSTSLLLRYQLPHTGCSASIRPFGVLAACSSWRIWRLDAQLPESAQERSSRFGSSSRLPRSSTSALAVRKSPRLREPGRLPLPRKYALWDFLTEKSGQPSPNCRAIQGQKSCSSCRAAADHATCILAEIHCCRLHGQSPNGPEERSIANQASYQCGSNRRLHRCRTGLRPAGAGRGFCNAARRRGRLSPEDPKDWSELWRA